MNDESQAQAAVALTDAQTVAHLMVDAASDKKAQDIVLLDVREVTTLADYFLICTATSERQLRAVVDGVEEALDRVAVTPLHREGQPADGWMLLDYGDVVAHIFGPAQRAYYRLEELWQAAVTVV